MDDERLRAAAEQWVAHDPDPVTRAALERALADGDAGELRAAVAAPLQFGTAGLRGEVGPGPGRMNRAVVLRTTWAVARHLRDLGVAADAPVCVGFDARPDSARFCEDVVGALVAAGRPVLGWRHPTPTPLVAWAARARGAAAAIVITASHNPPADNGYKLYGPDAVQISPPTDAAVAALIDRAPAAVDVPRVGDPWDHPLVEVLGRFARGQYLDDVAGLVDDEVGERGDVRFVHTSMHGVGGDVVLDALRRVGANDVTPVPEQHDPDGRFPTVAFPNPEEPGALDLAFALADDVGADVVLANDPDTDRLAVAVRDAGSWRRLSGNEVAVLLADDLLSRAADRSLVTTSIVTTPWVAAVAERHGARSERTLTGFKWIWRAALSLSREGWTPVLGAEEALGYSVGEVVRDKDGIGASVAFADLARRLAADGLTVLDRLEALRRSDGAWVAAQTSAVREGLDGAAAIEDAMERAIAESPAELAGEVVAEAIDMSRGGEERPPWLPDSALVEWRLADGRGRVLVRPSGTEPKLKAYVDLRADELQPADARAHAAAIGAAALEHVELSPG